MRRIIAIIIAAVLTVSALPAQTSRNAEVQFKAAQQKEEVQGDLKGALADYRQIAEGRDRALAVRALLRMAGIYQKQGDAEARKTLERIVQEFGEQKDAVAEAQSRLRLLTDGEAGFEPKDLVRVSNKFWTAVTPNGRYLVSAGLRAMDLPSKQERLIDGPYRGASSTSAVPSPDSRQVAYAILMAANADQTVYELRTIPLAPGSGIPSKVVLRTSVYYYVLPFGWSPDSTELFAMLTRRDGTNQIAAVSVDRGTVRPLKDLEWRWPAKLSLSPDGRYISYDAPVVEDSVDRDVFLIPADGSGPPVTVAEGRSRDTQPVWTPDSGAIVFTSDRSGSEGLWMVGVVEGKVARPATLLKDGLDRPIPVGIARNGTFFYSTGGAAPSLNVFTSEINLANATVLRSAGRLTERSGYDSQQAVFSPDGKFLAYAANRDANNFDPRYKPWSFMYLSLLTLQMPDTSQILGTFNAAMHTTDATNRLLVIRSLETGEEREFKDLPLWHPVGKGLSWFPNAQSIVFISEDSFLYRIDVTNGQTLLKKKIAAAGNRVLTVSPDGKRIFYVKAKEGTNRALTAYDVESERESEVFEGDVHNMTTLLFSPDGQEVVLRLMQPQGLYAVNVSRGTTRKLFEPISSEGLNALQWSADGKSILVQHGGLFWVPRDGGQPQRIGTATFPQIDSIRPDLRLIAETRETRAAPQEVWADPAILLPNGQARDIHEVRISPDGLRVSGPTLRVTQSNVVWNMQPLWSPDGKLVAFKRGRSATDIDGLVVRSIQTGEERTFLTGAFGRMLADSLCWFPDGTALLVGMPSTDKSYRLDLQSGTFTEIPGLNIRPHAISKDAKVYSLSRDLANNQIRVSTFDLATGKQTETSVQGFFNRAPTANPPGGMSAVVRLSPDGKRIALQYRDGPDYRLAWVAVDGGSYKDLVVSPRLAVTPADSLRLLNWSSDGKALLFGEVIPSPENRPREVVVRIMRIPAAGGTPVFTGLTLSGVTREDTLSISPDGTRLMFSGSAQSFSVSNSRAAR